MKLSYHLAVCVLVSCYCQSSLLVQQAGAEHDDGSPDESIRHQGSWSHWWSYDGISGPDYWNINKQWRSCSSGRKQSPINIRTERLVYDHLLGPIHLAWQREPSTAAAASDSPALPEVAEVLEQSASSTNNQPETTTTTTTMTTSSSSSASATSGHQHHVRVRLLNSGRGIEAWLEPGEGGAAQAAPPAHSDPQQAAEEAEPVEEETRRHHRHQLVVSRGPLSYSYKLFKIELHSSGNYAINKQLNEPNQEDNSNDDGHNDGGDGDADNHQSNVENNTPGQQPRGVPEASKWSSSGAASKSSEHLIDGKSLDAEVQLHFYNKQLALSSHEALNLINSAGAPASLFTIISVFVSLRRPTTTTTTTTSAASNATTDGPLDFIFNNLQALQNQGNAIELRLPRHHIDSLITTQSDYITYQGSLNRPPCAESVDWILLNKALRVDLEKFALLYEKLNTNQENIRPIKPLNGRQLRTSINLGPRNNHFYHQYEEKNCAKQSNCTNRAALNSIQTANSNQGGPIDDKEEIKSRWRQCSMKPNYVYQFSYGKSSPNTNR